MKHAKPDYQGKSVHLHAPHVCTPLATWLDPAALATAVPGCQMPASLNGLPLLPWTDAPRTSSGWDFLVGEFEEPAFVPTAGSKTASGAVVLEPDGRLWMVSPSNGFGNYVNTFPKGTFLQGEVATLRANAAKEVYEETGLKVRLTAFLCDSQRSTSTTRYYLGERLAGTPAEMGWESQAVHLVPPHLLPAMAAHANDQAILQALKKKLG